LRIDTQKKAYWGTLYRKGTVSCQQALQAFAHAFPRLAPGVLIPHGIYDRARHQGWLHLGLSRDTTAGAGDSGRVFWDSDGRRVSPHATAILLWCDGGGSHSGHQHLCKEALQDFVNTLGVPIRVAPSPAYCAQCNPIERRRCRHVTRACQGVLVDARHTVLSLIQKPKTPQGLAVTVRLLDTLYEGGRTVSEAFKKNMPIVCATLLPQWNYWAVPLCI
jgi:hypothetical protein